MGLDIGDLDRFLAEYDLDDNLWWTLSVSQMQEMFDKLLARYQELGIKFEQEVERLNATIDELRPMAEYGENIANEFP